MSDGGVVVGWFVDAAGEVHAFRWRRGVSEVLTADGATSSSAGDVNRHGQAVGSVCGRPSFPECSAVLWDVDGSVVELSPGNVSWAYEINDRGAVVGTNAGVSGDSPTGVLWQGGTETVIAPAPGGAGLVNNRGTIAAHSGALGTSAPHEGFRWRHGVVTALLSPTGDAVIPLGLNERDDVLAYLAPDRYGVWQGGGPLRVIDMLGVDRAHFTPADVDDRGTVVGTSYQGSGMRAFVADRHGTRYLPSLGGTWGEATAVDATGGIVGSAQRPEDDAERFPLGLHAVLWDHEKPTALREDVPGLYVVRSHATDVNRHGQVVGAVEASEVEWGEPLQHAVLWDVRGRS